MTIVPIPLTRTETVYRNVFRRGEGELVKIDESIAINSDYVMYVEVDGDSIKITMQDETEFEVTMNLQKFIELIKASRE